MALINLIINSVPAKQLSVVLASMINMEIV